MAVEQGKLKTPEENYEDAAMELALYRMLQRECDTVKERASKDEEAETIRMAEKSTQRMFDLIDRHTRKKYGERNFGRYGVRLLKIAALAILVLNLGLTVVTATSATVRAKVIEFLTEINTSYMGMGFRESGLDIEVPEDWEESYYPTFIPDGYVLRFSNTNGGISEAEYTNAQGDKLLIRICDITAGNRINTEGARISRTTVQGVNATVLQQPYEKVDVVWANGDRYFIVSSNDYETTLSVAESIKLIKK